MGSFFVNVQARARSADSPTTIAEAIAADAREAGWIEADEGGCDREVLVGPTRDGWVTVYDELAEMQNEEVVDGLARAVSAATGEPAVAVLMHDSDVLQLRRFDGGRRVDVYDSNPSYFEEVPGVDGPQGDPARWADLLGSGTVDELRQAWSATPVFAEEILADLAPRFGWSDSALLGYRYAIAEEEGIAEFRRLRFRRPVEAEVETEPEGPPDLDLSGYSTSLESIVDEPGLVALSVSNSGGASKGYEVQAWGSALERGLIEVEQIVVGSTDEPERESGLMARVGKWWRARSIEPVEPIDGSMIRTVHGAKTPTEWLDPEDADEDDEDREDDFVSAEFRHAPIPRGVSESLDPAAMTHRELSRQIGERMSRDLQIELRVRSLAPGRGVLHVSVIPRANSDEGTVSHVMAVEVLEPAWVPAAASEVESEVLRELSGKRNLVAVVTLGVDAPTATPHVAAAFERWHVALQDLVTQDYWITTQPLERGGELDLPARDLTADPRWARWVASLPHAMFFAAIAPADGQGDDAWLDDEDLDDDDREDLADGLGSCSASGNHGFSFTPGEPEDAPTVGLWCDTAGLDDATIRRLRTELTAIVDELVRRCDGVQAALARWSYAAMPPMTATPYESALGLPAQRTRAATSRRLRAVAETLWLSDALWHHLQSPASLSIITEQERLAGARRITLHADQPLAELERALTGILPDPPVALEEG